MIAPACATCMPFPARQLANDAVGRGLTSTLEDPAVSAWDDGLRDLRAGFRA